LLWISYLYVDLILHKTSVVEVLEHLAKRGYSVTLFAARSKGRYVMRGSEISDVQVPLRQVPLLSSIAFTVAVAFVLPYYVLFKRPTYIVTEPGITILGFLGASFLCRLRRVKLVLDIRSTPVEVSGVANRLHAFFFGVSVLVARELFDGMTVITAPMKEEVCNKFNVNRSLPGVWTSGVSTTLFDLGKYRAKGAELRKILEIGASKFVVFYHGNFGQKRGLVNSVKSLRLLGDRVNLGYRDILLFLLGNGAGLSAIREAVAECGVENNVVIHDAVDYVDVPRYIAMCDVGISPLPDLPDWRFQSPLNVLEYLSMEKPVIVTDIPAHRQIMGDSKCAIYAASAEPDELARVMGYAYDNRESLAGYGVFGRRIVEDCYTWDRVAENFDDYLSGLLRLSHRSERFANES
jgi:glycosyltransferase involved in cell wall biosynthesis